jgi:hypothetical protein
MPGKKDMPSTIARSGDKAQRTWVKTHDNAIDEYGEGERAHRTAFAALKYTHEKVGDHWEPKDHNGPSDDRANDPRARDKEGGTPTGGVDVLGHTKRELLERARHLGVRRTSNMTKEQLGEQIKKANDQATARARTDRASQN